MLNDNLKAIRKDKGYTQESLAIELNVVRQTVSKWEKGLSVPDAEMLQRLAEVFDVSVGDLLGSEPPKKEEDRNELAEQLAKINEQLAIKNRRARRFWKGVIIALVTVIVITSVMVIGGIANFRDREPAGSTAFLCVLDGEEYGYEFEYNKNFQILSEGGDAYISNHVDINYDDANQAVAHLKDWFEERGGTVTVTEQKGLKLNE